MSSRRKISRRAFLRSGAAVTASALAVPGVIPSGVLAREGRPGANDIVGVGYIGVGRRGGQLMGLPADARMVAVSDVHQSRVMRLAQRRKCRAYLDYRMMLESKAVDAVMVATPDHWHTLPCIHVCQAGKDVYCEKPLTLTIREGRLLVQAARKYKRIFQVGSQQRSMAPNRMGCELVRNGRIGKVHTVIGANYASPWECALPGQPIPEGLNWDRWCGATEPRDYHQDIFVPRANPGWISFRPYSGGEMTGWGSHGLDQVQWALGMDESGPVEVWTEGEKFDPPVYKAPGSRGEGTKRCEKPAVLYRYANGTVLKLANGPGGGAIFVGEKGKVTIDRGRYKAEPEDVAKGPARDSDVRLYVSNGHTQNWIECIKSRKMPVADVEAGHRSATVCHLGNIARWLGRKLRWDPEKEVFPGDAEANKLLDRTRRKPYELPDPV